jgi:excisionase family DNA binding protein
VKILIDVEATCVMLSIARTTLYAEVRSGRITPIKRGKRTFFHRDEIKRYVAALPQHAQTRR